MSDKMKVKDQMIKLLPPSIRCEDIVFQFLGAVKTRIASRQKAAWSRFIGAGFIAEDIERCWPDWNMDSFTLHYSGNMGLMKLSQLNLRELEELQKYLEANIELTTSEIFGRRKP